MRWLAPLSIVLACAATAAGPAEARRPPVIMITFDELPTDSLVGPGGGIDTVRYPGFASLARHSTWFPNATTVADGTVRALPAIMDGRLPTSSLSPVAREHPHSIFTLLDRYGYRVRSRETASSVCPHRICHNPTFPWPGIDKTLFAARSRKLRRVIDSIHPTRRPTFYFHHAILPHMPWLLLPDGHTYHGFSKAFSHDVTSPLGFGDRFVSQQFQQRHLFQLGYLDSLVGRLVDHLRREHMLEGALVVITADHGIAWDVGVKDRRSISRRNIDEVGTVPLFIKLPGQRRGYLSRSYARTIDIVPTIARALHMRLDWRADGHSVFGRAVRRRRVVRIRNRARTRTVVISAHELERRRRANVRRKLSLFGSGTDSPGLYGIGPNRGLIGKTLTELAPGHSALSSSYDQRPVFDPGAQFAPVWVSGKIFGGVPGSHRDLAVAVNGRIAAVGRSFHIQSYAEELLSLIVPVASLRPGMNDVAVFEVRREGGALRLELLGG